MLEYIPCYGGPTEHWGLLPATRLASRNILIKQNIKKRTGPALCVLCGSPLPPPPPLSILMEGKQLAGRGEVSSSRGWRLTGNTQGERNWSSLERQKVWRGLLVIHILWGESNRGRGSVEDTTSIKKLVLDVHSV
jgi:hypothetical protein